MTDDRLNVPQRWFIFTSTLTVCTIIASSTEIGQIRNGTEWYLQMRAALVRLTIHTYTQMERAGTRNHSSNFIERHLFEEVILVVSRSSILGNRFHLNIFQKDLVNGTRYFTQLLLSLVIFLEVLLVLSSFSWMTTLYCIMAVAERLESEDTLIIVWDVRSPDINPNEHVWDTLGRRLQHVTSHQQWLRNWNWFY